LLRGNSNQRAERFGKGAQRGIADLESNFGNRGFRFQEQFLGPLHPQAGQEMVRRRARDLVENSHQMKFADRSDVRESIQVQGLLQMRAHVAHEALHGFLIGFNGIGAMGRGERELRRDR